MTAAFLVDGHMEQKIAQRLCAGCPVRILNINGRDVQIHAIAKQVATQFRLLNNRYYPVVILIDREERDVSADDLAKALVNEAERQGVPRDQLIVGVADRMIENWILADPNCSECLANHSPQEGSHGKASLTKQLREIQMDYHETTIGVDLFCKIRPAAAIKNSESFRSFAGLLKPFCRWLQEEQLELLPVSE